MKIKILHLSDLHFTSKGLSQDIVISSLSKKIEELCKTESKSNILIITGDIAFSGKTEEYNKAKDFIKKIAVFCDISVQNIFIIPGNHDVDRDKLKPSHKSWWYNFKDENQLTEILSSEIALPIIKATTSAYFEFLEEFMTGKTEIGPYGEYVAKIPMGENGISLKIIGLNSAIFCGYDGDDQKRLALGLGQVTYCTEKVDQLNEIIISCVHHPFECFHTCEKPSINVVQRFSDIILSGHVHESNNSFQRNGNSGETIFITSGAAYEKRNTQNGFNFIEIDTELLVGNVTFYKYLPDEHNWIKNKDINHETDGVFCFEIKKGLKNDTKESIFNSKKTEENNATYLFVLDGKFDELDRDKFNAIEAHLKKSFKDVKGTIIKVEKSSIKIYFETSNVIPEEVQSELKKIDRFEILEIKRTDDIPLLESNKKDKSVYHWKTFLRPEYAENLLNPGATFTHSRADDLTLKDLFVSPNLKIISIGENAKEKIDKIVNANEALVKIPDVPLKIVIYGPDSSGKTTLVRWWYEKYYEQGYIPILITGNIIKDIKIEKIKKLLHKEFLNQYTGILEGNLDEYEQDRVIVFIDDFHKIRFTHSKYKSNLITNLYKTFPNLFITGNDLLQFETYTLRTGTAKNILEDFHRFQIIEYGPKLRYELIKKWNGIGSEDIEPNELIRLNNETEDHVESIIGKSFVPSYPIYLLTILQAREASSAIKPEFSIHGFYYELLINEALSKSVKNKADISLYYNFITDYCYFLFEEKIRLLPLFLDDFLKFHNKYCEDYKIEISPKIIIDTLVNSKLIKIYDQTVSISYKYVYYFFVARYLANNVSKEEIRTKVELLCQRVHRDEFASIVMFLTHLSKDQFILNQLLINSKILFQQHAPLKLEEDVSFINDMISRLPEQVYLPIDVDKMKEEELKEDEELDNQEKQFDSSKDIYDYDINEDISSLDMLSTMIKAIKTIEILGQVTKKYWGELKASQKYILAEETYMLGLRTLSFHFSLVGKNSDMLVEYLNHIYRKRNINKNISKDEIEKASKNFLFSICAMSSYGIVKRVTNAIGYEKLSGTFDDILINNNYNSVKLINTSIQLDHHRSFPWDGIKKLKHDTDKNYLASIILKNLVINYLYVFITSESEKQRICELVGIKMEQQRMIDLISTVKRESPK